MCFFLLFTSPCFTPLSLKNKLGLNTGQPSYCYSTTKLRLADFGKVIRLTDSGGLVGFLKTNPHFPTPELS